MSTLLKWVAAAATAVATLGSVGCFILIADEPTMPKSLIK